MSYVGTVSQLMKSLIFVCVCGTLVQNESVSGMSGNC